jgi:hypothetical protein
MNKWLSTVKQSVKGINTNFVEDEPDVFNIKFNRCLRPLASWLSWVSVINISILKFHAVLALCFRFHSYLRNFYAIL